jgi:hypothetical protein
MAVSSSSSALRGREAGREARPFPSLPIKQRTRWPVVPTTPRPARLDVERKELENKLLARRIELLEKSQEFHCCPGGEAEEEDEG